MRLKMASQIDVVEILDKIVSARLLKVSEIDRMFSRNRQLKTNVVLQPKYAAGVSKEV